MRYRLHVIRAHELLTRRVAYLYCTSNNQIHILTKGRYGRIIYLYMARLAKRRGKKLKGLSPRFQCGLMVEHDSRKNLGWFCKFPEAMLREKFMGNAQFMPRRAGKFT
jgi:hypothetical protein